MPGSGFSTSLAPSRRIVAVTASDATNDPNGPFRGLIVGAAGAVKLTTIANEDVTLTTLAAGVVHPIAFKRIWTTGTTATGLFGLRD